MTRRGIERRTLPSGRRDEGTVRSALPVRRPRAGSPFHCDQAPAGHQAHGRAAVPTEGHDAAVRVGRPSGVRRLAGRRRDVGRTGCAAQLSVPSSGACARTGESGRVIPASVRCLPTCGGASVTLEPRTSPRLRRVDLRIRAQLATAGRVRVESGAIWRSQLLATCPHCRRTGGLKLVHGCRFAERDGVSSRPVRDRTRETLNTVIGFADGTAWRGTTRVQIPGETISVSRQL